MTIQESAQIVVNVLKNLGIDPLTSQIPNSNGTGWAVPTDTGVLFLGLVESEGRVSLQISSPILFMPPRDLLPFYRKMLDLNAKLSGMALALDKDVVYLVNEQFMAGLPESVIGDVLQRAKKAADVLPDMLFQEFQSARYWRQG